MDAFLQYTSRITINWFDVTVVAILLFGLIQGRRQGMSHVLIHMLKWLAVIVLASFAYRPLAELIVTFVKIPMMYAYIGCYIWVAGFIMLVFRHIQDKTKGQLVSVDFFGSMEYYLGMCGGLVRSGCILIFCLALLHARQYTPQEIQRNASFQKEWFGSIRFPTLGEVHAGVFTESFCGKATKLYLGGQLIVPTNPRQRTPSKSIARSREDEVNSIMMGFGSAGN